MNRAKKLARNNGISDEKKDISAGKSFEMTKNKVLIILGVLAVVILCAGVCYMQLRPRPILKVTGTNQSGSEVNHTVYMKEAVYDIYQTELQYNQYESFYQQVYGTSYWEMEDADSAGRSGASAAKKQVMDGIKQREILCMEAEKLGYSLTEEEKKTAADNLKTAMENFTDAQKKMDGLDEKSLTTVFEKNALAEKYRQVLISESGIDTEALKATVDKDDYRQYTMQYYKVSNKEGSGDDEKDVSEEKKQENRNNMEALKEKAKTAEDFTKLIEENDETGITYSTEELVAKDMEDSSFLTKKLRKKLIKMKNDKISDVIEGEDGYYLIKMVNNNDTAAYDEQCEAVVEEEENKQFNERYAELKQAYVLEVQSYWKGRVKLGSYTTAD